MTNYRLAIHNDASIAIDQHWDTVAETALEIMI